MSDRNSIAPRAVMGLIAGGLTLFIFHLVMNPVPVAAGPAFVAGAIAFFLMRTDTVSLVVFLAIAGAGIGVVMHRNTHLSGPGTPPPEGLIPHLAIEGLTGLLAALMALLAMGITMRLLERR